MRKSLELYKNSLGSRHGRRIAQQRLAWPIPPRLRNDFFDPGLQAAGRNSVGVAGEGVPFVARGVADISRTGKGAQAEEAFAQPEPDALHWVELRRTGRRDDSQVVAEILSVFTSCQPARARTIPSCAPAPRVAEKASKKTSIAFAFASGRTKAKAFSPSERAAPKM